MSRFTKNNDGFHCEHCGADVPPASKTCRNHCPKCLHSKHVDRFPGDRLNDCRGLMRPIGYELTSHKGLMLHFSCTKCGERTRNVALRDEQNMPDDYEKILSLSNQEA